MHVIKRLIGEDNADSAIRLADRAWRTLPSQAALIAAPYGRLLLESGADHEAALSLLSRAAELNPGPVPEAGVILALAKLGRMWDAIKRLESALSRYCVMPGDELFKAAHTIILHPEAAAWGWVGVTASLDLIGELARSSSTAMIQVEDGERKVAIQQRTVGGPDGTASFVAEVPRTLRTSALQVSVDGQTLIGSGMRFLPDFDLDGRTSISQSVLSGWAQIGWKSDSKLEICIQDVGGRKRWVFTRATESEAGEALAAERYFELDLRQSGLSGSCFTVSALLPDRRLEPLPDSPLLVPAQLSGAASRPPPFIRPKVSASTPTVPRSTEANPSICVVIPVYLGRELALACIASVVATTDSTVKIIIVDDASPDPLLSSALDEAAKDGRVRLLRNPVNIGFVASVNSALRLNATHDVVLLNSDTRVFGNWLERLRTAAYSAEQVGTVTPFTSDGSIVSYANPSAMTADEAEAFDRIAAQVNKGVTAELPVGVGFCLYLRQECVRDVGLLDEGLFGKGYGEESDFCLRAAARGWKNVLAADVFVHHVGGVSFGKRRSALLDRSQRLLELNHPHFREQVEKFLADDPLRPLRRQLDESRLRQPLPKQASSYVLIVTLALSGGVDRFVAERCENLRKIGRVPLVLRPKLDEFSSMAGMKTGCTLWTDTPSVHDLDYALPAELPALGNLLRSLSIEHVEIQHFLGVDPQLIELVRGLSVPYEVFVHDYVWICPRVTLIDERGRYCGEPEISACEACIARNGSELDEAISVSALRARSRKWLSGARRVTVPSSDAARRLSRYFPDLTLEVQPLEPEPALEAAQPRQSLPIRIALLGGIGTHKGYDIVLACARDAAARELPIEFVIVGYSEDDETLMETGNVFVTGRYTDGEAAHLLNRERPHLAWFASVWPETWSYTLTHAVKSGLQIVAFDIGAIAERLRALNHGELLPLGMSPQDLNDRLLKIAGLSVDVRSNGKALPGVTQSIQTTELETGLSDKTASSQLPQEKDSVLNEGKTTNNLDSAPKGLSAAVQVLPLPPGLYLFSVGAASPSQASRSAQLALPAVNIGLGPGVSPSQVEFVSGPSTRGCWLFAPGDMLVARVGEQGVTLVMTSIRAPGGETLSIKIERLENRKDAETTTPDSLAAQSAVASASVALSVPADSGPESLPIRIGAHIRLRGDLSFESSWAGRVGPGLWIESFSVTPLERFSSADIEYKGLAANGFETPWLSDGAMCGTRHMGIPLVGFAVRLKPSAEAAAHHCEYSGYFKSGLTVGPIRNGAPCRSAAPNDALEGIQLRIYRRHASAESVTLIGDPANETARKAPIGPQFSKLRESE